MQYISNLLDQVEIPKDGILTRTIFESDQMKVVLFGFSTGQELSEHTSSKSAILHFLKGEMDLTLGEEKKESQPGTWVYMEPGLAHSLKAKTESAMVLILLK